MAVGGLGESPRRGLVAAALLGDRDGQDWTTTRRGFQLVDPTGPVAHVSYFEADAFAKWSGKRLPGETEWEVATRRLDVDGNFLDLIRVRP